MSCHLCRGYVPRSLWVECVKWNVISRVELDNLGGLKLIVIDTDAFTSIMNTDPHSWSRVEKRLDVRAAGASQRARAPHRSLIDGKRRGGASQFLSA
jgi:hypothetical protein